MDEEVVWSIDPAVLVMVKDAITVLMDKLRPILWSLTQEERMKDLKMGDKSVAFVGKAYDNALLFPAQVAPFVDVTHLKKERDAVVTLLELLTPLNIITRATSDTLMISGGGAMKDSNSVYGIVKVSAKEGVPGAPAAYLDMKARYPGGKKNKPPTPPAV